MKRNPVFYFSVSVVILIIIGVVSINNTIKLLKLEKGTSKHLEHTRIFEQTLSATQKAQIAVRNYIVTGNQVELKKRDIALKQYEGFNAILKSEISDPYLIAYLNALNGLRQNRILEYKIDYSKMREEKGVEFTLSYFTSLINHKSYSTEIPKLISKYQKREIELAKRYKSKVESDSTIVIFVIIIGSIFSIVITFFAILIVRKELIVRKKNELQLLEYTKKLKNRNTQLFDFSSIVSHNLRAPIVNIFMLTEFLEDEKEEDEKKEIVKKIRKVTNHINEVFNELIDTLQVIEDIEVESEINVFENSLNSIVQGLEILIKVEEVIIDVDFTEAPEIYFPKKYIDSILLNLLTNAIRYKHPDRKPLIQFKTQKLNNSILLSVSDNGLGIDLELHKERLFKLRQVFHNHSDAKGLGLFMTKTQVTSMGGEIWLESQINKGSTFYVEFKNQYNEDS